MDYNQFLQKPDEVLRLPYFGGKSVCDDQLTYRLRETLQPGWYQFRKSGRYLTVENPISPEPDSWKLPRLIIRFSIRKRREVTSIPKELHCRKAATSLHSRKIFDHGWTPMDMDAERRGARLWRSV